MKTSHDDKCCDQTKPATEVRMGREVASIKLPSCNSDKNAKCADQKEKDAENAASSGV